MVSSTEFDILKQSHKFLRGDDGDNGTWEDQLARKYYDGLWKEFAVCDLKHYKSGNFALRWRTEAEVLSGAGERSCANTRCPLHTPPRDEEERIPGLSTLELPFAYEERGERRTALVKTVLCARCVRKLMWKREREKAAARDPDAEYGPERSGEPATSREKRAKGESSHKEEDVEARPSRQHTNRSRSRSPRERPKRQRRRSRSR